jgi:hypothetical protein
MRSNIVLIDGENVPANSLELLDPEKFRVLLFVGAKQPSVPVKTAVAMQKLGTRAEYIQMSGNGPNALDFHIAYYIGVLSTNEPSTTFYLISKDTGFDPLIRHLKSRQITVVRLPAVAEILKPKKTAPKPAKSSGDLVESVADWLMQIKVTKPRSRGALQNSIASRWRNQIPDDGISAVILELVKRGTISIEDEKVSYQSTDTGCQCVDSSHSLRPSKNSVS